MRYFPSYLMKNVFAWFKTLLAHSINDWTRLERLFHEQFCMGQSQISLKELSSLKQKFAESINDYLNYFRLLKARCFTQVHEHEILEVAAMGFRLFHQKEIGHIISEGYGPTGG